MCDADTSRLADEVRELKEEMQALRADLKGYLALPQDRHTHNIYTWVHEAATKVEECRKILKGPTYR